MKRGLMTILSLLVLGTTSYALTIEPGRIQPVVIGYNESYADTRILVEKYEDIIYDGIFISATTRTTNVDYLSNVNSTFGDLYNYSAQVLVNNSGGVWTWTQDNNTLGYLGRSSNFSSQNASANYFFGDGSQLTGISFGSGEIPFWVDEAGSIMSNASINNGQVNITGSTYFNDGLYINDSINFANIYGATSLIKGCQGACNPTVTIDIQGTPATFTTTGFFMGNSVYLNADNRFLYFGAANDANIEYSGVDLVVNPDVVGTGAMRIDGNMNATANITFKGVVDGIREDTTTATSGTKTNKNIYYDFDYTGNTIGSGVTRNVYGEHMDLDYTGDVTGSEGPAFLNLYGDQVSVDYGGDDTNAATNMLWGRKTTVGGDIQTGTGFLKYGHDIAVSGAADENYGLKVSASGADTNYGVYVAAGDVIVAADNQKIMLGGGKDATLTYDGTNMVVNPKEVGSGVLQVEGELNVTEDVYITGTLYGGSPLNVGSDLYMDAGTEIQTDTLTSTSSSGITISDDIDMGSQYINFDSGSGYMYWDGSNIIIGVT